MLHASNIKQAKEVYFHQIAFDNLKWNRLVLPYSIFHSSLLWLVNFDAFTELSKHSAANGFQQWC